jgi:hypothetical protein
MKHKITPYLAAAAFALGLAGCATDQTASLPRIHYPVTYSVPVGNTSVNSSYGPQAMNVSASQDVTVQPNVTLYYQVNSPINITLYIYDKLSSGERGNLLGTMQGTQFTSSTTPDSTVLEFVFTSSQTNSNGTLAFTLSDTPITPVMPATITTTVPVTQQTTTTQTTTTSSLPVQSQ